MRRLFSCTCCAIALIGAPAYAQNVFIADLRGAAENPPVASPGRGTAIVIFDGAFQTMTVRTTYSDLTTPTTDAHIHCCSAPTANAVVAVGFRPAGFQTGTTAGQFASDFNLNSLATYNGPFVTANGGTVATARTALINGTQAGLAYVNIHTTRFPPGEIRGQLVTSRELTPQAYTLLPEIAFQTAEFQDSSIRGYLRDVRGDRGGFDGQTATLGDDGRIGMFLLAGGRTGKFRPRTTRPKVDFGSTDVMMGIDYRLGSGALIGVMAGGVTSEARLTPTSRRSQVHSWFGGAYASIPLQPFYFDLQASYGKSDYDLFRSISMPVFTAASTANANSHHWVIAGTAGLTLDAGGFDIEPYAGARYVNLSFDGFRETGNIAALTIADFDASSLQSIVGLRVAADAQVGQVLVRPWVRAEWRHEFKDDPRLIVGSFGGAGLFAFPTTPLGGDHAVIGSGISISDGGGLSFIADYTGQVAGGYAIHALSGGLRWTF